MDVIEVKILGGFLFFFLALTFGWTPYYCFRRYCVSTKSLQAHRGESRRSVLVQCLHSLASGVMLATCLLHLLPESLDAVRLAMFPGYDQHTTSHGVNNITDFDLAARGDGRGRGAGQQFPVAECLVAMGFLLIYIIDSIIRLCSRPDHSDKYFYFPQGQNHLSTPTTGTQRLLEVTTSHENHHHGEGNWRRSQTYKTKPSLQFRWVRPKFSTMSRDTIPGDASECPAEDGALADSDLERHSQENLNLLGRSSLESDNSASETASPSVEAHPLATSQRPERSGQVRLRSATLVSALCIHGFFDGVMLGLQTSLTVVTSLLLALSIHKSFVATGLSLTFLGSSDKKVSNCATLLYVLLFAAVAPLGLLLSATFLHGRFEASSDIESSLVPGCLQSFAVGTFLYVTLSELTEPLGHDRGVASLAVSHLFLLIGFGLMAALRNYLGGT